MTKKLLILLAVLAIFAVAYRLYFRVTSNPGQLIPVILVDGYDHSGSDEAEGIKSILQEEGVVFRVMTARELMKLEPERLGSRVLSIIFPDKATQRLPKQVAWWTERYVASGGWVLVSYDSGTKDMENRYHFRPLWCDMTGVDYFNYSQLRERTTTLGHIRITDKKAVDILEWPLGKRDAKGFVTGYMYGRLIYPISVARVTAKGVRVLMEGVTEDGFRYPVLTVRRYKAGGVMMVNTPVAALKLRSDDLPARNILRAFLFHYVKIPHLVSSPGAVGGLVINWHVDWGIELTNLMWFYDVGFFRPDLRYSMDVTAGPDEECPGDGRGFNAGGLMGMLVLNMMARYAEVGSHGGWAHNWFAYNIMKGKFHEKEIRYDIAINNEAIEEATGYKVRSYAAPNGVHPQPVTTRILEEMGINSYYYPGDSGSVPNRTFYNGKMVAPDVVAFPVMPYGSIASLDEAYQRFISDKELTRWLIDFEDSLVKNRVVRLWYSHPYDVPLYTKVIKAFLDHAEALQKTGRLRVEPMPYFADFLLKLVRVKQVYTPEKGSMRVSLYLQDGLRDMCIALPKSRFQLKNQEVTDSDKDYYYVCVQGNPQKKSFVVTNN